ncbi:hypothetical protein JCM3770_006542 [Rhodotorula araucariae]
MDSQRFSASHPRKRARVAASPSSSTATSAAAGTSRAAGQRRLRVMYQQSTPDEETATESAAEPSTEEDNVAGSSPRSRRMQLDARDVDDEGPEPDTEPSDAEEAHTGPSGRTSAEGVLDLTDDGDDAGGSSSALTARAPGQSLFDSRAGVDEEVIVTDPSVQGRRDKLTADRKGKGKARPRSPSLPAPTFLTSSSAPAASASAAEAPAGPAPRSLAHLACPICFGAPTPLALTSCGHAFCAPCLHAALVAGPALTPPPPGSGRGGRAGARGGLSAAAGFPARTAVRRGGRAGPVGATAGGSDDEGDPELDKHCPVCRTPLLGGWGKSLRGVVLRMAPVKR